MSASWNLRATMPLTATFISIASSWGYKCTSRKQHRTNIQTFKLSSRTFYEWWTRTSPISVCSFLLCRSRHRSWQVLTCDSAQLQREWTVPLGATTLHTVSHTFFLHLINVNQAPMLQPNSISIKRVGKNQPFQSMNFWVESTLL